MLSLVFILLFGKINFHSLVVWAINRDNFRQHPLFVLGVNPLAAEPLKPENLTRLDIDAKLQAAGWVIQYKNRLNQFAGSGGDVLITKMGEPPGDASIYPKTEPDAIISADCIKWRLSSLIDCPELYVHIVNSQLIRDQIVQRTKGVVQKKISLGTFRSIAFPLPPVEEQREILRVIEEKMGASDRLLREIERQLVRAERNKQSVLASAFSGFM